LDAGEVHARPRLGRGGERRWEHLGDDLGIGEVDHLEARVRWGLDDGVAVAVARLLDPTGLTRLVLTGLAHHLSLVRRCQWSVSSGRASSPVSHGRPTSL